MNKKYIFTVLISIISSVIAICGAYLFYKHISNLEDRLTKLHSEVDTLSIQSSRLINLRQVTNSTGSQFKKLQDFFVAKDGALDFVKYIEQIALSSGLVFSIDTVDEISDDSLTQFNASLLKVSMRATGSLKRVNLFLSLIESLPYNTKIQKVDLRQSSSQWTLIVDLGVVK